MNSRITAILIGLLSVTGVFATTVIEQNDSITNEIVSDSITNEIVSDSITMAMPSDSITIQVTDTDSIRSPARGRQEFTFIIGNRLNRADFTGYQNVAYARIC